ADAGTPHASMGAAPRGEDDPGAAPWGSSAVDRGQRRGGCRTHVLLRPGAGSAPSRDGAGEGREGPGIRPSDDREGGRARPRHDEPRAWSRRRLALEGQCGGRTTGALGARDYLASSTVPIARRSGYT